MSKGAITLYVKRIYEPASDSDGYRILVDRLWPRGLKKENAHIDKWLKDVAPSTVLRKWFNHEPEKWPQFLRKYHAELKKSSSVNELYTYVLGKKTVTLLYSARDEQRNQAIALQVFIHGILGIH